MTDQQPEPLDALRADVEGEIRRRWRDARWWMQKFVGAQLTKLAFGGVASIGLLMAALPLFAAAAAAAVVAAAVGYAIYARKQLVDERAMRRWAFVHSKRLQQDIIKRELALDLATLVLVNDPKDRESTRRLRAPGSPEFTAAVRYLRYRAAAAEAAQRPQPPKAAMRGATREVTAPDVAGVRRRRDLRQSDIAKLEAEIQALAAPDVLELAVAAAEAKRSNELRRAAAHHADRVARDRRRRGIKPTVPGPELGISVSQTPAGTRDVRRTESLTPEQIARGEPGDERQPHGDSETD